MGVDGWLFGLAALGLTAGCLVPNRWLPPLPNDKLLHFAGFALLSLLTLRLAHTRIELLCWLSALLAGGALIECLQALVPDRRFCWRDLAANAAGIAVVGVGALVSPAFS